MIKLNTFRSHALPTVVIIGLIALGTGAYWLFSDRDQSASQTGVAQNVSSWIRVSTYEVQNGGYDFTNSTDYNLDINGSIIVIRRQQAITTVHEGALPSGLTDQAFATFNSPRLQDEKGFNDLATTAPGAYFSVHVAIDGTIKTIPDIEINNSIPEYQNVLEALEEQVKKLPLAKDIRALLVATPLEDDTPVGDKSSFIHHKLSDREWEELPALQRAASATWKYIPVRDVHELKRLEQYVLLEAERGGERYAVTTPMGRYDLGLLPGNSE